MDRLKLIQELLPLLIEEMQPDEDHLYSRLGKKKPVAEVKVVKMEGEEPSEEMESEDSEESETDKMIKRLQKARGEC